ncbi:MAG: 50S ribosomal protein L25 [Candidatus Magasanikbacteria bacterium]|nr:50S ribosomal protein L25 [Candidatus Magasanikbacteria bacterium]
MNFTLATVTRSERGVKTRTLGKVPAVVYGAGGKSDSLALEPAEFLKLYKQAGGSSLIDLSVDGATVGKVLVQAVQHDPVSDRIIHVDFRRIDMNKAMTAPVTLRFVGEAPVIKSSGGTLVTTVATVEVKCLPKDLVSHIDVDLSPLVSYDVVIKVRDLKLPSGIEVVSPKADDLVTKAAPALTEEEIKAMEAAGTTAADLAKIEVAGEKEKAEAAAAAEAADGKAAPAAKTEDKKEEKKDEKKK